MSLYVPVSLCKSCMSLRLVLMKVKRKLFSRFLTHCEVNSLWQSWVNSLWQSCSLDPVLYITDAVPVSPLLAPTVFSPVSTVWGSRWHIKWLATSSRRQLQGSRPLGAECWPSMIIRNLQRDVEIKWNTTEHHQRLLVYTWLWILGCAFVMCSVVRAWLRLVNQPKHYYSLYWYTGASFITQHRNWRVCAVADAAWLICDL